MDFYTNVQRWGKKILFRGILEGKRVTQAIEDYSPSLFIEGDKNPSNFLTFNGKPLQERNFNNMQEAKAFLDKFQDISNVQIYGRSKFEYSYIHEYFKNSTFDVNKIRIAIIDIEVDSSNGFPYPEQANEYVQSITVLIDGVYYVWGLKEYKTDDKNVVYCQSDTEEDLLRAFVRFWVSDYPDVVTGWNTRFFDMPYLYNRIMKILGEPYAKSLSPWKVIRDKTEINKMTGKPIKYLEFLGISELDYLPVFKKFAHDRAQEEYSLEHIASVVTGEKKLDYSDYGTLRRLYEEDFQKFIEYNMRDCYLVGEIEKRRKLIELIFYLAYDAGCNYSDTFFETKIWNIICYNYLLDNNNIIMASDYRRVEKDRSYEGAFVLDPIPGQYNWVCSLDFTSLYPTIMWSFNISPDTLVRVEDVSLQSLLERRHEVKDDLTFCANGARFKRDKIGMFAALVKKYIQRRTEAKQAMLKYRGLYNETKEEKYKILSDIENMKQNAYKISINSLYGASGSPSFPFFDVNVAGAITITGQFLNISIFNGIDAFLNKILETNGERYIIYGDTDSCYVNLEPVVNKFFPNLSPEKTEKMLDKFINDVLQKETDKIINSCVAYLQCFENHISLKREVIANKAFFTDVKKRYALNVVDEEGTKYIEPKVKITGFEAVRSSTPKKVREEIREVLKIALTGTEKDLQDRTKTFENMYSNFELPEISPSSSVNELDKYTLNSNHLPRHVRAAIVYNNEMKKRKLDNTYEIAKNGSKIKMVELREPNPFGSAVIAFIGNPPKELELGKWVDYNKMFEKQFIKPVTNITDQLKWSVRKRNKLSDLF